MSNATFLLREETFGGTLFSLTNVLNSTALFTILQDKSS